MKNLGQSIFKKAKTNQERYAQILNELINNRNISYKALGIITYILSKPCDWQIYISDLIREGKDAEKSVRSGITELIDKRYMQRYRVFDTDTGKVHHWETLVSEEPFNENDLISTVKEKYLKDNDGNIVMQKLTVGKKTREIPIVLERQEILLSQNSKVVSNEDISSFELLSQNVQVENLQIEKEGLQILSNTKTNLKQKLNSSSSSMKHIDLVKYFEENICELKPSTLIKFKEIYNLLDKDFILKVIDYCSNANAKSYSYFESVIMEYSKKGINTVEALERDIKDYRETRSKAKLNKDKQLKHLSINKTNVKKNKFHNYDQRNYDFENLERKLLGWD